MRFSASLLAEEQFTLYRDGTAFALLVERHGPLVYNVCRRVLAHHHDAEDAFQATFLVLARRAHSIRKRSSLNSWLFGVAYRVAANARKSLSRRRSRETALVDVADVPITPNVVLGDLWPVLLEEVTYLPDKYRAPFVLCHLRGKTNQEAAFVLNCPHGTVLSRLARARERLRRRLKQRGIGAAWALLVGAHLQDKWLGGMPLTALIRRSVNAGIPRAAGSQAGSGMVSAQVTTLVKGVLQAMMVKKLQAATLVILTLCALGVGAHMAVYRAHADQKKTVPIETATAFHSGLANVNLGHLPPREGVEEPRPPARNFVVNAPTPAIAELIAQAAERIRKEAAISWLGNELPDWPRPCSIKVVLSDKNVSSREFGLTRGKLAIKSIRLEGTLDAVLNDLLPREITRSVLENRFGGKLPRWAVDGATLLAESERSKQAKQIRLQKIVDADERLIPLRDLVFKDYPKDILTFEAESCSLTRFLVERKGRKEFLDFVSDGERLGWNISAQVHYGYEDVCHLEAKWFYSTMKTK